MGHLQDDALIRATSRAVFVDIDPGFGQMWEELDLASMFGKHRHHVTVGLNVGGDSQVPDRGIAWITTLPPVSLEHWCCPSPPTRDAPLSTVATWRGPFGPVEYRGSRYGLRAHQFRRFLSLAGTSPRPIELALDIDAADDVDRRALVNSGFRLVDPLVAAGSPAAFRAYVHASAGELCIAKDLYVRTRSGWFSDRSACYLAAGRAVAHQDTGLRRHLPEDGGVALFTDPSSAARALQSIAGDTGEHSDAARSTASSHLDARLVIGRILEQVGVS
jgi:hypothetical protein